MNGYSSHTFSLINEKKELFYVKYHFKTKQGIKNFTREEADRMKSVDMDHSQSDLFRAIEKGDFPKWRLEIQVMPEADAATYHINPFDLTKVWPHADYPPIEVGEMELNRNPVNYFAEVEQAAFEPRNILPGMGFSTDRMLQGRLISYPDAHRYRLGVYLPRPTEGDAGDRRPQRWLPGINGTLTLVRGRLPPGIERCRLHRGAERRD